jgi:hypothetical protein
VPLPGGEVVSLPDLRADFAGREEMAFWVHRAHYSRSLPASTLVGVGFKESGRSIGCVIFSRGASSEIGSPFSVRQDEVCEMTRVAFGPHETPTSRLVSLAIKRLRKQSPHLRLLISFSDPMQHGPSGQPHVGTLYRACGWWFIGMTNAESLIQLDGKLYHPRTISSRFHTRSIGWLRQHVAADAQHVRQAPKFRFCLPLDAAMRAQLAPRVQAYPKAFVERDRSTGSGARGSQAGVVSFSGSESTREGAAHVRPGRSIDCSRGVACLS